MANSLKLRYASPPSVMAFAIAALSLSLSMTDPASAQCFSGAGGTLLTGVCNVTGVTDPFGTAIGAGSSATGSSSTAVGFGAQATSSNSTAFGSGAFATGANETSIGHNSGPLSPAAGSTNIGTNAGLFGAGTNSVSLGFNSVGSGPSAIAIGGSSNALTVANGAFSAAIGTTSRATAIGAIALGGGDGVTFEPITGVILKGAQATGNGNVAIGSNAQATGLIGGTAVGFLSNASATRTTAIGFNSTASAVGATAIGLDSTASGLSSIAIGDQSRAAFTNSAAIGAGVTATRANQQVFGTATNTYTLAGVTSAASLAAQTGPVGFVTSDGAGNLATLNAASIASVTSVAALDGRVTNLEGNVRSLNSDVRKAFEGAAVAIAMGGAALPDNKKFAISANWGNFSGENAFGGVAQMRITDNFVANAAIGAGFNRGGVGGRVGGTFAW